MGLKERKQPRWDLKSEVIQKHILNDRGLTWTSSDGNQLSISVMDTNHIKNALAKIERGELDTRKGMVPVLKMELIYRSIGIINEQIQEETDGRLERQKRFRDRAIG